MQTDHILAVTQHLNAADRARYEELVALLSEPVRMTFEATDAKARARQLSDAREELLAILRRAGSREPQIAALVHYFEGRDEPR
jgi:hypothetical protein